MTHRIPWPIVAALVAAALGLLQLHGPGPDVDQGGVTPATASVPVPFQGDLDG